MAKKGSLAASGRRPQPGTLGSKIGHEARQPLDRCGIESVVDPAPLFAVGDEPGFLERLQMKGQPGLGGVQRIGEVADALFTITEELEELETRLIAERVEP